MHTPPTPSHRAHRGFGPAIRLVAGLSGLAAAAILPGCDGPASSEPAPPAAAAPNAAGEPAAIRDVVRTTFHPTTAWARRIAGDLVAVDNPVPYREDPRFWSPTREAIAAYQQSRLIVVNGADFERWLPLANLPMSRVVDTTADFDEPFIEASGITHAHGPGGEHSHDGIDGHTWLDPINAIRQATTLAEAMKAAWPEHAEAFDANLAGLVADLEDLDARLRALTPRLESVVLLASHPAYDYLARRYGWQITNLDIDPDDLPSGADLASIRAAIPADRTPQTQVIMLWESEPLDEIRQLLFADMGVESVVYRPAESIDEEEDREDWTFLPIMRDNIDQIAGILPPA